MKHHPRNFSTASPLNIGTESPMQVLSEPVFALRSLLPIVADAIPRRFSSSSLPPSFASGRFADLCFPSLRRPTRAAACRG